MSLVTIRFVIFCVGFLVAYYTVGAIQPKWQWCVSLVGSVVFYLFSGPWNALLLLATVVVTYGAAVLMEQWDKHRKVVMVGCIVICVGLLLLCKFDRNFLMPLGISFYTFQSLSYVIDCYKGKSKAQRNFLKYVLFVSFFPQIGQGPIGRYDRLAPQLYVPHGFDYDQFAMGIIRMLIGAFKKLFIANQLALFVDAMYENPGEHAGVSLLVASVCYTIQLYADFSGYMDLAIGIGQACGIHLDENFRAPYLATSIRDFWNRWHLTLSTWLRDYLYIPLGGNRKGFFRKNANILIVMLVSGIWHGNTWNFLIWGGLHGLYQVIESIGRQAGFGKKPDVGVRQIVHIIWTFFWVNLAWVFFRLPTVGDVVTMMRQVAFGFFQDGWKAELWSLDGFYGAFWIWAVLGVLCMLIMDLMREHDVQVEAFVYKQPLVLRWAMLFCLCFVIFVFCNSEAASSTNFLYYRF